VPQDRQAPKRSLSPLEFFQSEDKSIKDHSLAQPVIATVCIRTKSRILG
jgi:hypothetical protein